MIVKAGRLVLALVLVSLSAYCVVSFVTMPYELVTTTNTSTRAIPDGSALWVLAIVFGALALVAAFSSDWH